MDFTWIYIISAILVLVSSRKSFYKSLDSKKGTIKYYNSIKEILVLLKYNMFYLKNLRYWLYKVELRNYFFLLSIPDYK